MKILFINESTVIKGGIDIVLETEFDGLKKNGIDVELLDFSHKDFLNNSILNKFKHTILYFSESERNKVIEHKLKSFKPDIIHFHNTYPILRKPWWMEKKSKNLKVVQHLHNYYPFCLNSFFFIDGKICTDCFINNNFSDGIRKSCYDYSKFKSFFASFNRPVPHEWIKYSTNVDLFLGVSNFIVDKYIELGLDEKKIKRIYNGINIEQNNLVSNNGSYVLFLGNIVYAKGINIVCELAKQNLDIEFVIAGLGRDLQSVKSKYNFLSNLKFMNYSEGVNKKELLMNSKFLLLPYLSWESFGLVNIEALAYGKPIITSGLGGTSELIEDGKTGFIVKGNNLNSYQDAVRRLWENKSQFKIDELKQKEILSKFCAEKHIANLIKQYNSII
ncbi:MAG: glycosyltransferase family 4 protein [Ignavibacteriae bacterium]|nr:glycosyltransferase family 4 protein [Ignavibacteriota bacterium]